MRIFGVSFDRRDVFALGLPVFFAFCSWLIWLAEIVYGIGWMSLAWLRAELASVYVVAALAVGSYLSPIVIYSRQTPWPTYLFCFTVLYISSLAGFFLSKNVFFALYSRIAVSEHIWQVWMLFFISGLVSAVFFYVKQIYLFKSHGLHVFTLMFVFLSVIPASLITIDWFPGLGKSSFFVDAVKMGYPAFWVNILLGQCSYFLVRRWI